MRIFPDQSANFVKVTGQHLGLILWQGEQWAVTDYGLERRDGRYAISAHDFFRPTGGKGKLSAFDFWDDHLSQKKWCNREDLLDAIQSMLFLYDEKGRRTRVEPPSAIDAADVIDRACEAAEAEYARVLRMYGLRRV